MREAGITSKTMTDQELIEAVEEIDNADVDSIAQYDDGRGHFVINSDEDDQDIEQIDEALEEAGYERDGILNPPGMTQQNFKPKEEDEE